MEVLSENQYIRDVNFLHAAYYPTELMLYFEKHHIFEILLDLMILLDKKRPDDIYEFMAEQLVEIARKYNCINLSVEVNASSCRSNYDQFVRISSRMLKAPVIQIKYPTTKKCFRKLSDELKRFRLHKKNLIYQNLSTTDVLPSKLFADNRHIKLDIDQHDSEGSSKLNPLSAIVSAAQHLNNTVKILKFNPDHAMVKYVERIAIIGRPGSGTHWQARILANRLDAVLVSVKELINSARLDSKCFKKTLEIGLEDNVHTSELITSIVEKRLLERECLQFGWILVDFPNTAEDVENLFRLMVVPQKILFLHANERLCRKRMLNQLKSSKTITAESFDDVSRENMLETEFNYFNFQKRDLIDALRKQNCILLDINANHRKEKVQKDILKILLKL
ncbi:uncharacterized protein LOC128735677 [Sabethes cyaneus]|uniref:uncharacterized protein LOC128735677 n=1 Tax=Sabethes cyaneus TaxID=53552 RepID=UPI00237EE7FE|nr:uncharacterized protein LOC128735677 [Sabethes cyaneus]